MINVIEKKCYQNGKNSVCVIKFNINYDAKFYNNIGFDLIRIVIEKFIRKYKAIMYNDGGPLLSNNIFTVVGKAKCSPDDKFDAEKGMELAMQRAYQKVNAYNWSFISMFSNELEQNVMKKLYDKRNCTNNQLCENTAKINELSK